MPIQIVALQGRYLPSRRRERLRRLDGGGKP
jgi:hypothetical protein